jgi:hypothetical protein
VHHAVPSPADWSRVAGTYEIRVCRRGPCDDAADRSALRTLFVSIQPDSIPMTRLDEATRFMLMTGMAGAPPWNACFTAVRLLRPAHTYAGLSGVGVFYAEPDPITHQVTLWPGASVDAFYRVDAVLENGRLEGVGRSEQVPFTERPAPDTVVGRRIGPPDPQRCIAVARKMAADMRRAAASHRE